MREESASSRIWPEHCHFWNLLSGFHRYLPRCLPWLIEFCSSRLYYLSQTVSHHLAIPWFLLFMLNNSLNDKHLQCVHTTFQSPIIILPQRLTDYDKSPVFVQVLSNIFPIKPNCSGKFRILPSPILLLIFYTISSDPHFSSFPSLELPLTI